MVTGKRLVILRVLARFHDHELFSREFINLSGKVLKFSTIDMHLARLEGDDLIISRVVNNNGHSGRLYSLTKAGIRQLKKRGVKLATTHARISTLGL